MHTTGISTSAANVLVIGTDTRSMGQIREALGTEAVLPAAPTAYEEALLQVRKVRPDLVIVGFDSDFDEAIRVGTQIHLEQARVVMVALASRTDNNKIRAAMRAGYREFVTLPDDAELLRQALHEATFREGVADDGGAVTAFWGSKGGVGTTLLSVNLSSELAPVHKVCLVDFDFTMGDAASFLDLNPAQTINDLVRNLHRLDERMLSAHVSVHPSKLHVLAQPSDLNGREEVSGDIAMRILTMLANGYQHVVVDCGHGMDDAVMTAITVADHILLVATHDVPGIRNTMRRLQMIENLGIEKERVRLVLNHWDKRNTTLSLQVIEDRLRREVDVVVSEDKLALKGVNEGKILRELDRKAQITRDIEALVGLVTDGDPAQEKKQSGGVMDWLFGR